MRVKMVYVRDLLNGTAEGDEVFLQGWLRSKRQHGKLLFLDVVDSTGVIQAVADGSTFTKEELGAISITPNESGIEVKGKIRVHNGVPEIRLEMFEVVGEATLRLDPAPRSNFDIFDPNLTDHLLKNRHLYIRNPKIMAILRFRSRVMAIARRWFEKKGFQEFDAPILTPAPLYDNNTAMGINVHGEDVYLSQCAGFYLEAAAHAFERVYNMGPSFRGEESRSKRHLMEYWHIKAELAFGNREDIMGLVEEVIGYITQSCLEECQADLETLGSSLCLDGLESPFPRISYEEAVVYLKNHGFDATFGLGISTAEEEELSRLYSTPFWIVGIPRSVEPFPYVVDPDDTRVTMVADLIASRGYGELLGVAEKIHDPMMLKERLNEKGKLDDQRYEFVREVHEAGCVPHIAFGMGLERLIRWLLDIPHVRDTIPFPRVVRRNIMP